MAPPIVSAGRQAGRGRLHVVSRCIGCRAALGVLHAGARLPAVADDQPSVPTTGPGSSQPSAIPWSRRQPRWAMHSWSPTRWRLPVRSNRYSPHGPPRGASRGPSHVASSGGMARRPSASVTRQRRIQARFRDPRPGDRETLQIGCSPIKASRLPSSGSEPPEPRRDDCDSALRSDRPWRCDTPPAFLRP